MMDLNSKNFPGLSRALEKSARNPIFPNNLLIGLNIPFARKRRLFCVDLDPRWTPESRRYGSLKITWRSIGFDHFKGVIQGNFSCRFGPPICVRGAV